MSLWTENEVTPKGVGRAALCDHHYRGKILRVVDPISIPLTIHLEHEVHRTFGTGPVGLSCRPIVLARSTALDQFWDVPQGLDPSGVIGNERVVHLTTSSKVYPSSGAQLEPTMRSGVWTALGL